MRIESLSLATCLVGVLLHAGCGLSSGDGARALVARGRVEMTEVDVSSKVGGRLLTVAVREGQSIAAGQEVARLDDAEVAAQLREAEAGVRDLGARLEQARLAHRVESRLVPQRVQEAEAQLRAAEAQARLLEAGGRREEIEQARYAAAAVESRLANALVGAERARRLQERDVISRQERDDADTQVRVLEAEFQAARQRVALLEAGARAEELASARAQVDRARALVAQAREGEDALRLKAQEIQVAEANLDRARAVRERLRTLVQETRVLAPAPGTVLRVLLEPGEILGPGRPVVILGDLRQRHVRVFVPEREVGRIRLGQPASVVADAHPDRPIRSEVTWISQKAEFTPKNIQTREEQAAFLVFAVKVRLEDPEGLLRSGMHVEVRFPAETAAPGKQGATIQPRDKGSSS